MHNQNHSQSREVGFSRLQEALGDCFDAPLPFTDDDVKKAWVIGQVCHITINSVCI